MNDDDWVARLLGEAERPTMPADVADRLDRTLQRYHADPAALSQAQPQDGVEGTQDPTGASGAAGAAGATGAAAAPATGAAAAPATEAASPAREPGRTPPPAPAADGVPVAAVPPTAGSQDNGPTPLRAGSDDGEPQGAGPDAVTGSTARTADGRTFGTRRREQRADDQGERRRRLLSRWAPVAAGVLVLGAAGALAVNVLDGSDGGSVATEAQESAAGAAAESVTPRSLVASGTEYGTADTEAFAEQVRQVVTLAGSGEESLAASQPSPEAAQDDAAADTAERSSTLSAPGADPAAARAAVEDSPLSDPEALRECIQAVTNGTDETAAAVDLALVDGVESTVVVVDDPASENLFVYVVGPECTVDDSRFDFFTVSS